MRNALHCVVCSLRGLAVVAVLLCAPLSAAELEPIQVGQPQRIEVFPASVKLTGPRRQTQLVVTGIYADGSVQDLTRVAEFPPSEQKVFRLEGTVVNPVADGTAELTVSVGGQTAKVPVQVTGSAQPQPLSFEYDTLAALTKHSCNSGACHGSPSGKGGFRLSLRAFDTKLDQLTLIREDQGRRTNQLTPETSLLLAKPLMHVPHGGGQKLKKSDPAYAVLRDWIAEGCQPDPANTPKCVRIEAYPPTGRVLKRPAHTQQISVVAHFSDGSSRDVTELACYDSSDIEVAEVNANGFVVGHDRGETAIVIRYHEHVATCFLTFVKDIPGYEWKPQPQHNFIDELVDVKLRQLQFAPSGLCSDEEFLRRVYLDLIGLLPTVEETNAFLAEQSPNKRKQLIDRLLERPEFAKFWALKWGDLLKLTTTQVGGSAVHKYHRWIEAAWRDNLPYDQFARQLLVSEGSTLAQPAANFYRTTTDANDCVETVSQVFMGARIQCAKCHNHPFEQWTQDNYYGMSAFFSRVQRKKSLRPDEMLIFTAKTGEVTQPRTGQQMKPWLPQRGDLDLPPEADRRPSFAEWLIAKDNPYFARVEANRLWSHLFGKGIVDPVDDFRDSNPPSNAALLDRLAKEFADHNFDRKHLLRTILQSRTYQADYRPNEFNKTDTKYCSHQYPRLLAAEQLLDAICSVTGLDEQFGPLPPGTKATQVPAPDIAKHEFLKTFGQPERQTVCQCERVSDSNLSMAIQFFNGPLIYNKLRSDQNRFRKAMAAGKSDADIITELYLAALCRKPSEKELQASLAHIAGKPDRVVALEDVCWAILNMNEFLFQH
jgi:hypothetical protein